MNQQIQALKKFINQDLPRIAGVEIQSCIIHQTKGVFTNDNALLKLIFGDNEYFKKGKINT